MSLAALPIARPDFNRRRVFLLPPFKINTAGTPHIVELQKTFLNAPRHPPTQHGSCQCDTNRVFVCPSYFWYYAA